MKNTNNELSGKDETKKPNGENEIREDKNNSINTESYNKFTDPHSAKTEDQYKNQPEFIDRNSDSKDKS